MTEYIGCAIKQLPPHQRVEAARVAISHNPSNKPLTPPGLAAFAPMSPEHLALLTSKYWGAKGVHLTVQFLDNPDVETRRKILAAANLWSKTANISFTETAGQGQVRIARGNSGYWSYLGTDILSIPPGEQTMNLQGFTASTPDSEYLRVVCHEVGHSLGFPHEHERPEIIDLLDPEAVIADFAQSQGWSRQEVIQQVLTSLAGLDPRSGLADVRGIMCYAFSGKVTKSGQPIPGGTQINDEDYKIVATLYPKETAPQPPTPPGPPPGPPAAGAGEVLVRANLPVGWYVLYPGPPRGRFSSVQVIQAVAPGHFGLQAVPGSGLLQETGEWPAWGAGPVEAGVE